MKHEIYEWNDNGVVLFAQSWTPELAPIALICHIHGQSDHSSRFAHVAEFFVKNNIAFFAIDLVGHGKSTGKRGHISKFNDYLENVELLKDEAIKRFPGLPLFIYGHSMGGTIVLTQAYFSRDKVAGYIVTSPWIQLAFEPSKLKVALGSMVKEIFPGLTQPTGLDANLISHDATEVEKYKIDPLVHGKITTGAYFEIKKYGAALLTNAHKLRYPVLLMHGSGDQITSSEASRQLAEKRSDLITYKEYAGLYHELHNEPERDMVFNDILNWINAIIKK